MIQRLLSTTALLTLLTSGAYAAETPVKGDPSKGRFLSEIGEAGLASQWIGETVYASEAENAETLGEIEDLIVGTDGDIDAAVIGVGGFLGVGEKDVAVSFESLKFISKDGGDSYVVLETTKEELNSAPEFTVQAVTTPETPSADNASPDPAAPPKDTTAAAPDTVSPPALTEQPTAALPKRDTLKSMDIGTISSDTLINATVYSTDDQNVGEIGEVLMTDDGKIDAVVIDVGGFIGIGEKPVAIAYQDLEYLTDESGTLYVYTTFTEEQLKGAPDYVKDAYKQNRDSMILKPNG